MADAIYDMRVIESMISMPEKKLTRSPNSQRQTSFKIADETWAYHMLICGPWTLACFCGVLMEVEAYLSQRRPLKNSIAAAAEPTYAFGSSVEYQFYRALQMRTGSANNFKNWR